WRAVSWVLGPATGRKGVEAVDRLGKGLGIVHRPATYPAPKLRPIATAHDPLVGIASPAGAALADAEVAPDQVDEMIIGQVLITAAGMNPAQHAARLAGFPMRPPLSSS